MYIWKSYCRSGVTSHAAMEDMLEEISHNETSEVPEELDHDLNEISPELVSLNIKKL